MMEVEYKNAKKAYENYNLNNEYKISENILEYVKERININKNEIDVGALSKIADDVRLTNIVAKNILYHCS